jgi:hypothetical protein
VTADGRAFGFRPRGGAASGRAAGGCRRAGKPAKVVCVEGEGHARLSCGSCHTALAPRCPTCHTSFDGRAEAYDWVEFAYERYRFPVTVYVLRNVARNDCGGGGSGLAITNGPVRPLRPACAASVPGSRVACGRAGRAPRPCRSLPSRRPDGTTRSRVGCDWPSAGRESTVSRRPAGATPPASRPAFDGCDWLSSFSCSGSFAAERATVVRRRRAPPSRTHTAVARGRPSTRSRHAHPVTRHHRRPVTIPHPGHTRFNTRPMARRGRRATTPVARSAGVRLDARLWHLRRQVAFDRLLARMFDPALSIPRRVPAAGYSPRKTGAGGRTRTDDC